MDKLQLGIDQKESLVSLFSKSKGSLAGQSAQNQSKKKLPPAKSVPKEPSMAPGFKQYKEYTDEANNLTHNYIQVTQIKETVYNTMLPTLNQTKRLFEDCVQQGRTQRDQANNIRDIRDQLRSINNALEQFATLSQRMTGCDQQVHKCYGDMQIMQGLHDQQRIVMQNKMSRIEKTQESQMKAMTERDQRYKEIQNSMENAIHKHCVVWNQTHEQDVQKKLFERDDLIEELRTEMDKQSKRMLTVENNLRKKLASMIEEIQSNHKKEMEKIDKHEHHFNGVTALKKKIETMQPQVNGLTERLQEIKEIPQFIEKSLPPLLLMTTGEYMKEVFVSKEEGAKESLGGPQITKRILDFERQKIEDICKYNKSRTRGHDIKLGTFNKRIQALVKGYQENDVGVLPFKFGDDFSSTFLLEDLEKINQEGIRYQDDLLFQSNRSIKQVNDALKQFADLGEHSKGAIEPKVKEFSDHQLKTFQKAILRQELEKGQISPLIYAFGEKEKMDEDMRNINDGIDKLWKANRDTQKQVSTMKGPGVGGSRGMGKKISPMKGMQKAMKGKLADALGAAAPASLLKEAKEDTQESKASIRADTINSTEVPEMDQNQSIDSVFQQSTKPILIQVNNIDESLTTRPNQSQEYHVPVKEAPPPQKITQTIFCVKQFSKDKKVRYQIQKNKAKFAKVKKDYKKTIKQIQDIELMIPEEIRTLSQEIEEDESFFNKLSEKLKTQEQKRNFSHIAYDQRKHRSDKSPDTNIQQPDLINAFKTSFLQQPISNAGRMPGDEEKYKSPELKKEYSSDEKVNIMGGLKQRFQALVNRQMKLQQIENARPYFEEETTELSSEQVQDVQVMIDRAVDWVRASLKMSQQVYIEDLKQAFDHVKANFQKKADTFDGYYKDLLSVAKSTRDQVKHIEELYSLDHKHLLQFKQRLFSDITRDMSKIIDMTEHAYQIVNSNQGSFDRYNQLLPLFLENSMIDSLIQSQELEDRKRLGIFSTRKNQEIVGPNQGALNNIGLPGRVSIGSTSRSPTERNIDTEIKKYGELSRKYSTQKKRMNYSPLKLDKNCRDCSSPRHLYEIKQACLSYISSPVVYKDSVVQQNDLIDIKDKILLRCQQLIAQNKQDEQANKKGSVGSINKDQVYNFLFKDPQKNQNASQDSYSEAESPLHIKNRLNESFHESQGKGIDMVERALKDNKFELTNRGVESKQRNTKVNSSLGETLSQLERNKKIDLFDPSKQASIKNEFDMKYLNRKQVNDNFNAKIKSKSKNSFGVKHFWTTRDKSMKSQQNQLQKEQQTYADFKQTHQAIFAYRPSENRVTKTSQHGRKRYGSMEADSFKDQEFNVKGLGGQSETQPQIDVKINVQVQNKFMHLRNSSQPQVKTEKDQNKSNDIFENKNNVNGEHIHLASVTLNSTDQKRGSLNSSIPSAKSYRFNSLNIKENLDQGYVARRISGRNMHQSTIQRVANTSMDDYVDSRNIQTSHQSRRPLQNNDINEGLDPVDANRPSTSQWGNDQKLQTRKKVVRQPTGILKSLRSNLPADGNSIENISDLQIQLGGHSQNNIDGENFSNFEPRGQVKNVTINTKRQNLASENYLKPDFNTIQENQQSRQKGKVSYQQYREYNNRQIQMHHKQVRKSLVENSQMTNQSNGSGSERHSAIGQTRAPGLKTSALKVVTKQEQIKEVVKFAHKDEQTSRQSTDEMHSENANKRIYIPTSPKLHDVIDCRRLQANKKEEMYRTEGQQISQPHTVTNVEQIKLRSQIDIQEYKGEVSGESKGEGATTTAAQMKAVLLDESIDGKNTKS